MRNILIYFAIKYRGDFDAIMQAIRKKETISAEEIEKIKSQNISAITCLDSNYPSALKGIYNPPFVLFYKGNIELINAPKKLAVIGTREPTEYGVSATKKVLGELFKEKEIVIVSGLAKGIDGLAHQEALNQYQKTIAVLGSGIDICYPFTNRKLYDEIAEEGLILSEYPSGVEPSKDRFPQRNRIIAALSDAILVTQAFPHSGTQITVNFGLEYGKEILAIPQNIDEDSFCNHLISEGALPIFSGKDIIDELF